MIVLSSYLEVKPSLSNSMIFVKSLTGTTYELHCNLDDTVETMKDILEQEPEFAPNQVRLLFAGSQLEDGRFLSYYNTSIKR